jgi:D-alanine-D-alanine ligase
VIKSKEALHRRIEEITSLYKQPVIVEQFLSGREFTVGILGNHPDFEILPIIEIDHSRLPEGSSPIYSYEAKWIWDTPKNPLEIFRCPAIISRKLRSQIEALAARTCALLRIRDWCRIDVRLNDKDEPNILEVNPLPGILPDPKDNSCLPKAARAAGYSYSDLIHRVVKEASRRYSLNPFRIQSPAEGKLRLLVGQK